MLYIDFSQNSSTKKINPPVLGSVYFIIIIKRNVNYKRFENSRRSPKEERDVEKVRRESLCSSLRWLPLTLNADDAVSVNTWENILFRGEPPPPLPLPRRPAFYFFLFFFLLCSFGTRATAPRLICAPLIKSIARLWTNQSNLRYGLVNKTELGRTTMPREVEWKTVCDWQGNEIHLFSTVDSSNGTL